MADTTVTTIANRIDAINQTIGTITDVDGVVRTVHTSRYFPTNIESSSKHPLLVPLYSSESRSREHSDEVIETQRWDIIAVTGAVMQGIPSETTQKINEAMIQAIKDTYDGKIRLQNSDAGLGFIDDVILQSVTTELLGESTAMIRFQFQITVEHITEQD